MHHLHFKNNNLKIDCPAIMGILNITPDSFSDGGQFPDANAAVYHAKQMIKDGADIIDIGGESTRPNSTRITAQEELKRILPILKILLKETQIPISIDTMKPEVADECFKLGAHILNDVTGLRNDAMIAIAAKHHVPVIIMHMQGTPETMQLNPTYQDPIKEIKQYLKTQADKAKTAGIKDIIIDPGIGFGKTVEHNLKIIKHLHEFKDLGYPILVGPSRKSFIGKIIGTDNPTDRLEGTLAAVTACVLNGADILRVHDVKQCKRVIEMANAIKTS